MATASVYTWLVTGSSRGIGLEIVRQLSLIPENVIIATCRTPDKAETLMELKAQAKGQLHVVKLDVSDESSIKGVAQAAREIVGDKGLDYLINNAAVNEGDVPAFKMAIPVLINTFRDNVAGPAALSQQLLPLIEKSRRRTIAHLTSGLASFGLNFGGKNPSYTISKTALNMLASAERPDLIVFVVDPGWVKTDMGGQNAMLEPQDSVSDLIKLFTSAGSQHSGKFFNHRGEVQPW
ncbi:sniffer [Punctularia strigosozonata HHB-11173 SS5]|uniref:sniffer n=1 Tax=Punctularia strigosozonata (strain HHB-11173) TaxID=741275 RepID=UPI000441801F|nr:sniffer [Punctularia strigosozonata HHB-11173 SS5]EIN08173.1 sniffer [Punctularia strigosozonata HHB-11173 SS5]